VIRADLSLLVGLAVALAVFALVTVTSVRFLVRGKQDNGGGGGGGGRGGGAASVYSMSNMSECLDGGGGE